MKTWIVRYELQGREDFMTLVANEVTIHENDAQTLIVDGIQITYSCATMRKAFPVTPSGV